MVPNVIDDTNELEMVLHDGAAPVFPINTWPVVPAAVTPNAEVVFPYKTPLAVNVVAAVPPAATGSVPAAKAEADV